MSKAGSWNSSFIHVTDILPTILEITEVKYPEQFKGENIHPYIGKSIKSVLQGDSVSVRTNEGMGWELFEMKAYISGNWKILRLPKPMGTGEWQLYDIEKDPAETTDLSAQFPEIKEQLIKAWNEYAKQNEVHDHKGHFDSLYIQSFAVKEND